MPLMLGSGSLGSGSPPSSLGVLAFTLGGESIAPAYVGQDIFVSASTEMDFTDSGRDWRVIVSSAHVIWITGTASAYISPILRSAEDSFSLTDGGDAVVIGDKYAEASNSFSLSDAVVLVHNAVYYLFADDSFGLDGEDDGTCRDLALSASNSLDLDASEAGQNRDISVSATTEIGIESDPESNGYYDAVASTTVILIGVATFLVSGTPASNSFSLTDFAQATVVFPWRRTALTLPPGGGLPHS